MIILLTQTSIYTVGCLLARLAACLKGSLIFNGTEGVGGGGGGVDFAVVLFENLFNPPPPPPPDNPKDYHTEDTS